jgi:hypothetical protein
MTKTAEARVWVIEGKVDAGWVPSLEMFTNKRLAYQGLRLIRGTFAGDKFRLVEYTRKYMFTTARERARHNKKRAHLQSACEVAANLTTNKTLRNNLLLAAEKLRILGEVSDEG